MLPQQYHDPGDVFHRTSGWVQICPAGNEAADVRDILCNYGCRSEVVGTYLDSLAQIQVVVWVVPMPDVSAAEGVYNNSNQPDVNDWGIWCPGTGVGSQTCQEQWRSATFYQRTGFCHRYLMHAYALYVDLRSGSAALPALTLAATAANRSIGAWNIPGTQCQT